MKSITHYYSSITFHFHSKCTSHALKPFLKISTCIFSDFGASSLPHTQENKAQQQPHGGKRRQYMEQISTELSI